MKCFTVCAEGFEADQALVNQTQQILEAEIIFYWMTGKINHL